MDRVSSLLSREELTFGGVGIAVAVVLLIALRVVLSPAERSRLRVPLVFLLIHVVCVAARALLPVSSSGQRLLAVLAVLFLLLSIGRSAFLLLIDYTLGRRRASPLPAIFRDIIQGLVYAAVALITLRAAGMEPGSLLTTSALLTAIIGLSLQATLGNMVAGLAIQTQRPFDVGDWIQFDADLESIGRVVEINWRATKLHTVEQLEVVVPNSVLANAPIKNYSKPGLPIRRSVFVQAPYEVPPGRVQEVIMAAIQDAPGVLSEPEPTVVTRAFQDSGIEYWIRFFIEDFASRDIIQGAVRDRVWYAFSRAQISIPFPIRTVHLHEASVKEERDLENRSMRRARIIRCVDFLAALPDSAVKHLVHESHIRRFAGGEIVIHQGDEGDELFIIDVGEVVVMRERAGRQSEVARLSSGGFFGEMSLTTGENRTATVRTTKPSELLVVDRAALQPILEDNPEFAQTISAIVAQRQVALEANSTASTHDLEAQVEQTKNALLGRIRTFFKL